MIAIRFGGENPKKLKGAIVRVAFGMFAAEYRDPCGMGIRTP